MSSSNATTLLFKKIKCVEFQVQNKSWDIWSILWTSLPPTGTMFQVNFDLATFPNFALIIGRNKINRQKKNGIEKVLTCKK